MELLILNTDLISVFIMDTIESLIWTERYSKAGDFELYTPVNDDAVRYLRVDYFIYLKESEKVMMVEALEIKSDVEKGNHLIVTGRSLESILERRILWSAFTISGNIQNGIRQLLNDSIITPSIIDRKIANFIFEVSDDPIVTSLSDTLQYKIGENLYDVIRTICEKHGIGFKITLTEDNNFKFKLYSGVDRSYDQMINPYVLFSPSFNNLKNSNYLESKKELKTITLVNGESESLVVEVDSGGGSGIERREIFTDASSEIHPSDLIQKGKETLITNINISSFDGEIESPDDFRYEIDFFLGDIVQIENEYGMESKSRVTEVIRSQSPSSVSVYPTFTKVE